MRSASAAADAQHWLWSPCRAVLAIASQCLPRPTATPGSYRVHSNVCALLSLAPCGSVQLLRLLGCGASDSLADVRSSLGLAATMLLPPAAWAWAWACTMGTARHSGGTCVIVSEHCLALQPSACGSQAQGSSLCGANSGEESGTHLGQHEPHARAHTNASASQAGHGQKAEGGVDVAARHLCGVCTQHCCQS